MNYIKENIAEFEICNIIRWHELGYTGEGIKVANMEKANPKLHFFDGKVRDPFSHSTDSESNLHGNKVIDVIHQIAPSAEIFILPNSGSYTNGKINGGDLVEKSHPFMRSERIHLVNASLNGVNNGGLNNVIRETQEHGVSFLAAAGNEGEDGLTNYAKSEAWISVAALGYKDKGKNIYLKDYSSIGEELNVSCFSGLYIHDSRNGYEGRTFQVEGTSFSSPMLCGMLALVQQFFLEKAGRTLYQDEIELFIKDNVKDLGIEGRDEEYGHGLFILPDPKTIQIERYLLKEVDEMSINNPDKILIHHSGTKDGETKDFDGIRNHHINVNGWADVGYHYVVEKINGKYVTIKGREENVAGVHCPGQNSKSIGICLVGDFGQGNPPKEQLEEATKLIKDIRKRYNEEFQIYSHSDFRPTECPSFDLKLLEDALNEKDVIEEPTVISWQEKQGLEHLENLVEKGRIDSPDYWKDKLLEPMPVWSVLSLIDRITNK